MPSLRFRDRLALLVVLQLFSVAVVYGHVGPTEFPSSTGPDFHQTNAAAAGPGIISSTLHLLAPILIAILFVLLNCKRDGLLTLTFLQTPPSRLLVAAATVTCLATSNAPNNGASSQSKRKIKHRQIPRIRVKTPVAAVEDEDDHVKEAQEETVSRPPINYAPVSGTTTATTTTPIAIAPVELAKATTTTAPTSKTTTAVSNQPRQPKSRGGSTLCEQPEKTENAISTPTELAINASRQTPSEQKRSKPHTSQTTQQAPKDTDKVMSTKHTKSAAQAPLMSLVDQPTRKSSSQSPSKPHKHTTKAPSTKGASKSQIATPSNHRRSTRSQQVPAGRSPSKRDSKSAPIVPTKSTFSFFSSPPEQVSGALYSQAQRAADDDDCHEDDELLLNSLISSATDPDTAEDESLGNEADFDAKNCDTFFSDDTSNSFLLEDMQDEHSATQAIEEFRLFDSCSNLWTPSAIELSLAPSPIYQHSCIPSFGSVPGMIASPEDVQTLYFMFDCNPMCLTSFA